MSNEKHYSRQYLREKYKMLKHDMEGVLDVLNEDAELQIDPADIDRTKNNLLYCMNAIKSEITK